MASSPAHDLNALLADAQQRGLPQRHPVRYAQLQSLARRSAGCADEVRARLWSTAQAVLNAASTAGAAESAATSSATEPPMAAAPPRRPLRDLLDHLANQTAGLAPAPGAALASTAAPDATADAVDLKALRCFRPSWARLSADLRVRASLTALPEGAGPLNSQRLMHRSLALMREVSPEYLDHFVSYVDALLWLDDLHAAGQAAPRKAGGRAEAPRQRVRSRGA